MDGPQARIGISCAVIISISGEAYIDGEPRGFPSPVVGLLAACGIDTTSLAQNQVALWLPSSNSIVISLPFSWVSKRVEISYPDYLEGFVVNFSLN
jgi:hypothetical protein